MTTQQKNERQKNFAKGVFTIGPIFLGVFLLGMHLSNPRLFKDPQVLIPFSIVMILVGVCVNPIWKWVEKGKKNE